MKLNDINAIKIENENSKYLGNVGYTYIPET